MGIHDESDNWLDILIKAADAAMSNAPEGSDPLAFWIEAFIQAAIRAGLTQVVRIVRDLIKKNPKIKKQELLGELRELREVVAVSDSVVAVVNRGNGEIDRDTS